MTKAYDHMIRAAVQLYLAQYGYDWRLYKAQLWAESRLLPNALSSEGAEGVAQFMPETWLEWSPRAGFAGRDPTDPEAAIYTGAMYMAYLIGEWSSPRPQIDRYCLAMASYNAGFGNILKAQGRGGMKNGYSEIIEHLPKVTGSNAKETTNYIRNILKFYAQLITGDV